MERAIDKERAAMFARYADGAARHTMQVDFSPYLGGLRRVDKQGRQSAARRGGRPSVTARAAHRSRQGEPEIRREAS